MENEQLAVFVSITQLFTSYWHMKGYPEMLHKLTGYPEMLHELTVTVKTDNYQMPKKIDARLP